MWPSARPASETAATTSAASVAQAAIGDHENEETTRSVNSEISSEESGDDRSSCSSRRGLYAKNQAQGILSKLDVLSMGCSCEPTFCPMSLACG